MPHALETERLILRPYAEDDIQPAFRLFENDPEVYRYDPGFARTIDQRAAIIRRLIMDNRKDGEGTLAVTIKATGEFIGQVGLELFILAWSPFATPEIELCYKFGRAYWSLGYAQEACRGLLHFAFADIQLLRVVTIAHAENQRSVKLLVRLGFNIGPAPAEWTPHVLGVLTNPAAGRPE